jgi:hypothetical protein
MLSFEAGARKGGGEKRRYKSLGVIPVFLLILDKIAGPSSSESSNDQVYSPRFGWTNCLCEEPFFPGLSLQPARYRALRTFLAFVLAQ